jgi:transposase InsO family protein
LSREHDARRGAGRIFCPDNGCCYRRTFSEACTALGLRHLHTRPYRPRTNGKAERFIQTLINEWAYARVYSTSAERTAQLKPWLVHYNSGDDTARSATRLRLPG